MRNVCATACGGLRVSTQQQSDGTTATTDCHVVPMEDGEEPFQSSNVHLRSLSPRWLTHGEVVTAAYGHVSLEGILGQAPLATQIGLCLTSWDGIRLIRINKTGVAMDEAQRKATSFRYISHWRYDNHADPKRRWRGIASPKVCMVDTAAFTQIVEQYSNFKKNPMPACPCCGRVFSDWWCAFAWYRFVHPPDRNINIKSELMTSEKLMIFV